MTNRETGTAQALADSEIQVSRRVLLTGAVTLAAVAVPAAALAQHAPDDLEARLDWVRAEYDRFNAERGHSDEYTDAWMDWITAIETPLIEQATAMPLTDARAGRIKAKAVLCYYGNDTDHLATSAHEMIEAIISSMVA